MLFRENRGAADNLIGILQAYLTVLAQSGEQHVFGLNWALSEQRHHFELGHVLNCAAIDVIDPEEIGAITAYHTGLWECNLADNSLIWSGGVYDLFGLDRSTQITREGALAHYTEDSRAKMERLRAYAIRHGAGFTLDVEIRSAAIGRTNRVRLIAASVYEEDVPVRLHGLKLLV